MLTPDLGVKIGLLFCKPRRDGDICISAVPDTRCSDREGPLPWSQKMKTLYQREVVSQINKFYVMKGFIGDTQHLWAGRECLVQKSLWMMAEAKKSGNNKTRQECQQNPGQVPSASPDQRCVMEINYCLRSGERYAQFKNQSSHTNTVRQLGSAAFDLFIYRCFLCMYNKTTYLSFVLEKFTIKLLNPCLCC